MIAYHIVNPDKLNGVLKDGLKCTSRGKLGSDDDVKKADKLLDSLCPEYLKQASVSRDNNLYAFLVVDGKIKDIDDGNETNLDALLEKKEVALELHVDPKQCFVSNLDLYDAVKEATRQNKSLDVLEKLAKNYWKNVYALTDNYSQIDRPELMITYDISPKDIKVVS